MVGVEGLGVGSLAGGVEGEVRLLIVVVVVVCGGVEGSSVE